MAAIPIMCYHTSTPTRKELKAILPDGFTIEEYESFYHKSGFDHPELPVALMAEPQVVQPVMWGYVPEKATPEFVEDYLKKGYSLNAKAETIFSNNLYKYAAKSRRCLIFIDGFFEWKHVPKAGKIDKVPYYIRMPDGEPFALGGLYSQWENRETGEVLVCCNILTTAAVDLMVEIHNSKKRMPFILPRQHWAQWLDAEVPEKEVKQIIKPYPEGRLEAHEISRMITSRKVDTNVKAVQEGG